MKAGRALAGVYEAQLLTYLRLSGCRIGLIFNFAEKFLSDGIQRVVLNYNDTAVRFLP